MATNKIHIALVGNPNSGKTSLFNNLTGLNQKVGNFPGVTVDKKSGELDLGMGLKAELIDLPGSYSLYPRRADEWVSYRVLMNQDTEVKADVVVIVADASTLKRNLLFVSQIIDLKIPAVLALTMMDVARKKDIIIDLKGLERELGIPVVPVNPRKNKGIDVLKKAVEATAKHQYRPPAFDFIPNKNLATDAVNEVKEILPHLSDYAAIHHLINHESFLLNAEMQDKIETIEQRNKVQHTRIQAEEIMQRYQRIKQIVQNTITEESPVKKQLIAEKLDRVLLHRFWGYAILLTVLFLLFQSIFWIAQYPMDMIELFFLKASNWFSSWLPDTLLTDLFINGVLAGLSGIFVFVPQIMILFGLITILEETGYMARIGFLTDKIMRKVGLNGKSVMPMISGFACAVPAIMSVRNIENQKERLLTILVTPLMSCSARLPVYTILIALVIPKTYFLGFLSLQGLVMMGLYVFSVVIALVVSYVAKRFIKLKEKSFFILELPLYRHPRYKNVVITMIEKAKIFVFDAGKIIMVISLLLWALSSYGPGNRIEKVNTEYAQRLAAQPQNAELIEKEKQTALLQNSYAGVMGQYIEPVIKPLGYDWKIGIALITSFAAREVFVGTMATLYSVDSDGADEQTLRQKMHAAVKSDGTKVYTLATGVSLMIFYLLAMQCMSTLAIVKRETRSWKWPIIQLVYMTGLAYILSLIAYQLLK
ncbi:ferrous iron transport protein B [Lacibacter sediminis]|uniref:Ferrous iron transport protein B n=1 Tax=Lacibacter sediminis TaxID=2760713 RepID=A0A7G5XGN3_9BACT|nr:ferrous iron transport protein B [Lacibacter sediminis]QNA44636.1 ferrous iron transport protein B [Lacibacter sediminis]